MRNLGAIRIVGIAAWLGALTALGAAQTPDFEARFTCLDAEHVVVEQLLTPLPADSTALRDYLWENYFHAGYADSFDCRVWDASTLWPQFVEALVAGADALDLDGESLRAALATVHADRGRNAYLPIGATRATVAGEDAWVIQVKWEWRDSSSREVLGHMRVYVLAVKDQRQLFFTTCS